VIKELYQKSLMRLAANAYGAGKMDNPDAEGTMDNPTCGDRITIQVRLDNGKITELVHDNRACMLCQASASLLAENAIGLDLTELEKVQARVTDLLKNGAPGDEMPWEKLSYFEPVRDHKSRHLCVLLPLNALQKILKDHQQD